MSAKKGTAGFWSSLLTPNEKQLPVDSRIPARQVREGKLQPPAKDRPAQDRATESRAAIYELNSCLPLVAGELEVIWDCGAMSQEQADCITQYFRIIIETVDKTLQHKQVGAPPTLRGAKELRAETESFYTRFATLTSPTHSRGTDLDACLRTLYKCVTRYIDAINFAYAIVKTDDGKPILSNRRTDWAAKKAYASILDEYQALHGRDNFPKPKSVHAQLAAQGFDTKPRTIREWRTQWDNNTFWNHVQDRNRQ